MENTQTMVLCPHCEAQIPLENPTGDKINVTCPTCGKQSSISIQDQRVDELDFYPVQEPYAYVKILRNPRSFDNFYTVIEPVLSPEEKQILQFIQNEMFTSLDRGLNDLDNEKAEEYIKEKIKSISSDHKIRTDELLEEKLFYYLYRETIGYGRIHPLMNDPNIEDISCDGARVPIFLYHREYGSLRSNVEFDSEDQLSSFVVRLAQKCGKHISIAEPMLDATMPDGSRIQMTLSTEVTAKGSTFTIRKFRSDPFTPTDLINFKSMSSEMVAYMWMAVENGVNALIAGGTAAGKTSTLNALSLFIPKDAKVVSIEETREINLPHPNWIPGVARSGFGEIVADRMVGEIDMYDLMKAALRQRPEYIIVGEIRGKEAYVLFQAMATGHTTYSTFHADSAQSLIHRLEGKPIEIPRVMLSSLNIITIQISTKVAGDRVRRCKQIIEIIDIDPMTKEILTNEVFRWNSIDDSFIYSGKSYILERVRLRWDMSKEDMVDEMKRRVDVIEWMREYNIREFKDVAHVVTLYKEHHKNFQPYLDKMLEKKKIEEASHPIPLQEQEKQTENTKVKKKRRQRPTKQKHRFSFWFKKEKHKKEAEKS